MVITFINPVTPSTSESTPNLLSLICFFTAFKSPSEHASRKATVLGSAGGGELLLRRLSVLPRLLSEPLRPIAAAACEDQCSNGFACLCFAVCQPHAQLDLEEGNCGCSHARFLTRKWSERAGILVSFCFAKLRTDAALEAEDEAGPIKQPQMLDLVSVLGLLWGYVLSLAFTLLFAALLQPQPGSKLQPGAAGSRSAIAS
jgi:hypothetical protein